MKKLAIMFAMLLGSIATMQAQSFDFSCETTTLAGYSSDQVNSLESSGFTIGLSDNGIPTANFEGMVTLPFGTVAGDISVQYSDTPNTINPGGNGFYSLEFTEYYSHRILYGIETARYTFLSNSAEETIAFLATLLP